MKTCIITPTFEPHFKYIKKYLKSFDIYVEDKDFPIYFIINRSEEKKFKKIIAPYTHLNINIIFFDDLLEKNNIQYTPSELLNKYDKYCYQTMKKIYTMLNLEFDYYLLIDSESMWINPTNMQKLFEDYFHKPYFAYSSLSKRDVIQPFQKLLIQNINYLLKENLDNDRWFLETFSWFVDKKILLDIINEYGTPLEMSDKLYEFRHKDKTKIGLFEGLLYYQYIFKNNKKYKYNIIDIDKELHDTLKSKYQDYISNFKKEFKCNGGVIEFFAVLLNDNNYKILAKIFKKHGFNIIRCENSDKNYRVQKKFMKILKPNLLVVSAEHLFCLNNTLIQRLKRSLDNRYTKRLKKRFKFIINPFLYILKYAKNCIMLIIDMIKTFVQIIKKLLFLIKN